MESVESEPITDNSLFQRVEDAVHYDSLEIRNQDQVFPVGWGTRERER